MGDVFPKLDEKLTTWIGQQKMFFVSTAPASTEGFINCSPKGLDSFRIIDPLTVAYLDLTGSGIETAAHLKENGRILIMFCAFEGAPKILRLHGTGTYHELNSEGFKRLAPAFPNIDGVRGFVEISIHRISDSCGWGVPKMSYTGEREALHNWVAKKGEVGLEAYRRENNSTSIDGLPGI